MIYNIEALPELSIANLSSISPPLDSTPVIEETAAELIEEELEVEIEDPMTGNFQEERFQNMSPTPNGEFSDDEEKEV